MGISGRYEAHGQDPRHKREVLHLRVDVDRIAGRGPVMNWISGDVFEGNELNPDRGKHVFSWRIKVPPRDAAEDDGPRALPFTFGGMATRLVSGSAGTPLPVSVDIREETEKADLLCTVTLTMPDGVHAFEGQRQGPEFRTLELGVTFCTDAFRHPDCDLIPSEPAANVRRLSLDVAFAEAGVGLKQLKPIQVADLSESDTRAGWTTSELHASLEAQLVNRKLNKDSDWPRWFLCGLLADRHTDNRVLGVMFDEKEPNRQGFAVFQTHNSGPPLPPVDVPLGAEHLEALRLYFFTWVHEMGHGFNLGHSNLKARKGALSWMNDDGALKGSDFWNKFTFSFDKEEIVHIRHGNWEEIVMGALPLGRGGHLRESPSVLDCSPAILDDAAPAPPLQLVLHDGGYFDLMRPVTIHVELRNGSDKPLLVNPDLTPEGGHLVVLIRRPDGRTIEYVPPVRVFRGKDEKTLQPHQSHRQLLHLTYGRDGFYFDDPGQYVVRAVYLGEGTDFIVSNRLHLRVGFPLTAAHDRLAQEFFSPDIGRCLYFGGSASPYLGDALGWLTGFAADELARSTHDGRRAWLGADIARVIADGIGTTFRYMAADGKVTSVSGRPGDAAALTQAALGVIEAAETTLLNPRYRQLVDKHEVWATAATGTPTDDEKQMRV